MLAKPILSGICVALLASAAGDTRLSEAAMRGDRAAVRTLLSQQADVDEPQGDGTTALYWAAFRDDPDMAKALIRAGANVRIETREGGITPLFVACRNGSATMINLLLSAGAAINAVNSHGTTPLMEAAASGSVDAVQALLDHGADVNAKENVHGQTALMFAAALNRAEVIRVLIAHHGDPNVSTSVSKVVRLRFDQDGNIIEDKPSANGRARGAAPAAADKDARVSHAAAEEKVDEAADAADAAKAVKAAGEAARDELDQFAHSLGLNGGVYLTAKVKTKAGDVTARAPARVGPEYTGGMTALLYAAREGQMEAVRALVESGADINETNGDKYTPLVLAIANGHLDMAKYLLDQGADPKIAALTGLTALYAVIDVQWAPHAWFPQPDLQQEKTSYLDLMKALIDSGANVNAALTDKIWFRNFARDNAWVDPIGSTPFWRAAQSSDTAAMKLLAEYGADPKKANKAGDTPLHVAAGIGWAANWTVTAPVPQIDAVKMCIELGNDVNATDNRGYTPLHGAAYLGNNDMVMYLISRGAKVDVLSKAGDSVADLANGPNRFGQPHPETVALLEKLGSANSHNCRSDFCVVASKATVFDRPLTKAQLAEKADLNLFAMALGMKEALYRPDAVQPLRAGGGR